MVEYLLATEEQKELGELAYQITSECLKGRIEELEAADNGLGKFPIDVQMKLAEAGFYGMNIPEEYGGLGFDKVTQAIIMEQIAKVDAGFAFSFYNMGTYFPVILMTSMPEEEKRQWAERILSGEARGCFGITEPNAGSDAAAMKATAVYDPETNEYVLNGTKCFMSNAPVADHFVLAAWTDKTKSAREGVTLFFIEKERGIQIGKKENKMGLHLSETSDIILEDVRVPADHVVGKVGEGFGKALGIISDEGRALGMSFNVGLAQAALDEAIEYAKTRRQFGKRIIDHEGLAFIIADMKARTEASRALMYQTLMAQDQGIKTGTMPSICKMYISDCTMQTTLDAVQVLGGYGYMHDYPVEKYMRDAKIFQIFSGTNQIQRRTIAKALAGKDPEKKK